MLRWSMLSGRWLLLVFAVCKWDVGAVFFWGLWRTLFREARYEEEQQGFYAFNGQGDLEEEILGGKL